MNRLINPYPKPGRAVAAAATPPPDDALGRLVKYIPAEVLSGYTLLSGIVEGVSPDNALRVGAAWGIFALGVVLTPVYFWRMYRPTGVRRWHYLISTLSFIAWAYALGGPFKLGDPLVHPYESWLGAVVAGAFSWAVAAWAPQE